MVAKLASLTSSLFSVISKPSIVSLFGHLLLVVGRPLLNIPLLPAKPSFLNSYIKKP